MHETPGTTGTTDTTDTTGIPGIPGIPSTTGAPGVTRIACPTDIARPTGRSRRSPCQVIGTAPGHLPHQRIVTEQGGSGPVRSPRANVI
ncbi:hypothetical protein [Streptomyces anulatus]|uniref:hypothetical protein n=1 Tax=Streptomyces anulatus TaxID=1892 RepID=UPI003698EE3D